MCDVEKDESVKIVDFSSYEAMDRLACLHDSFHTQIVNHLFYQNVADNVLRDIIELIDEKFGEAYQLTASKFHEINGIE